MATSKISTLPKTWEAPEISNKISSNKANAKMAENKKARRKMASLLANLAII